MAFDLLIRAFFTDSGLSAGLARANAGLNQLGKSGPGARAGLRAVEFGARQLAFQAVGLSSGLGNLARGLLMFGGGSALMLGAVAGIGGLALAYRHFTKDSREAAEAQKKLREELHRVAEAARGAAKAPTQLIGEQQGQRGTEFQRLTGLINARKLFLEGQVPALLRPGETKQETRTRLLADDKKLTDLYRERRELGLDIATGRESAAAAAKKEADETRKLHLEELQFGHAQIALARSVALERRSLFRLAGAPAGAELSGRAFLRQGAAAFPTFGAPPSLDTGPPTFRSIRGNVPRFVPSDNPEVKRDFLKLGQVLAQSFMQAVIAFRQGGPGGVLGGFGALAAGGSQIEGLSKGLAGGLGIAGLGLSTLGAVFSLFDNSEDRRHREQMEQLRRIERAGQDVGLDRVTVVFTGPDGHQVRKTLAELESGDAVERVPGPVGATG